MEGQRDSRTVPDGRTLARLLFFRVFPGMILANLLFALWPKPPNKGVAIRETYHLLRGPIDNDSWKPMRAALKFLEHPDSALPLYKTLFFDRHIKFQYPPSSLLPLKLVEWVSPQAFESNLTFNAISYIAFFGSAFLCTRLLIDSIRPSQVSGTDTRVLLLAMLGPMLLFYPFVKSVTLGQIQSWLNGIFVAIVVCFSQKRFRLAGVLLGMVCIVKPQLAVLIPWAMLRKRWSFVTSALLCIVVLMGISVIIFGVAPHQEYLSVLRFIGQRGEGYYSNQSINGLLNRWFLNGNNVSWESGSFPAFMPAVYIATVVSSAALVLTALFWKIREHDSAPVVDLCVAGLTFTIASPVAWEHHYGISIAMYAATYVAFTKYQPLGVHTRRWLFASFLLLSSAIPATTVFARNHGNVLQSYMFFAALFFLVMLYRLRAKVALAPQPAGHIEGAAADTAPSPG